MDASNFDLNDYSDCCRAVRMNNRLIHRSGKLWRRFSWLPGGDQLVYMSLRKEFPENFLQKFESFQVLLPPGDPRMDVPFMPENAEWEENMEEEPEETGGGFSGDALNELDIRELKRLLGEEASNLTLEELLGMPKEEGEGTKKKRRNNNDAKLPPEARLMEQANLRGRVISTALYQSLFDWSNLYAVMDDKIVHTDILQVMGLLAQAIGCLNSAMMLLGDRQSQMSVVMHEHCRKNVRNCDGEVRRLLKSSKHLQGILGQRADALRLLGTELNRQIKCCQELNKYFHSF